MLFDLVWYSVYTLYTNWTYILAMKTTAFNLQWRESASLKCILYYCVLPTLWHQFEYDSSMTVRLGCILLIVYWMKYSKGWHGGAACSIGASQLPGLILSSGWIDDSKLLLGVNICVWIWCPLMDYWPTQGLFPPHNRVFLSIVSSFTKALTRIKWLLQMNKWIQNECMFVYAETWVRPCAGSLADKLYAVHKRLGCVNNTSNKSIQTSCWFLVLYCCLWKTKPSL